MVADLLAAYEIFITQFAVEKGLIDEPAAMRLLAIARDDLIAVGRKQGSRRETRKGRLFLDLIASTLAAGKYCHIQYYLTGLIPQPADAFGWSLDTDWMGNEAGGRVEAWKVLGTSNVCIGYANTQRRKIYLIPDLAVQIANAASRRHGDGHAVNFDGVGQDLIHEKLCKPEKRDGSLRPDAKRTIRNSRRRYFVIKMDDLIPGVPPNYVHATVINTTAASMRARPYSGTEFNTDGID
jgi:hypothetical protein